MNATFDNRRRRTTRFRPTAWAKPFVFVALTCFLNSAFATCPPERSSWQPPPPSLVVPAQLLYNVGNAFLNQTPKDYTRALEMFMNSRAVYPSPDNSLKAAECLRALGRFPEALVLYKEILARFDNKLNDVEKNEFRAYIAELQKKIVTVYVREPEGSLTIDDETCGSLPRTAPVYLMPGTHEWRVSRFGKPQSVQKFSGIAGSSIILQVPRLPTRPQPPETGKWFVALGAGPAVGLSNNQVNLDVMTGVVAHGNGGYRFANGMSIALDSGAMYTERQDATISRDLSFGENDDYVARYNIVPRVHMFAPFMGVKLGFEPHINDRFDFWIRSGMGIMGVQAKQVLTVEVTGPSGEKTTDVAIDPRASILRNIPAYAAIEAGFSFRVGPLRLGIGLESLITFHTGARFVGGRAQPRAPMDPTSGLLDECDTENEEGRNIRCVPATTYPTLPSYRPTFFLIPQIVVGIVP